VAIQALLGLPFRPAPRNTVQLNQAMFRHIKKIGLGSQYRKNKQTRTLCRELMSLNLLPAKKKLKKKFNATVEEVSKMRDNALLKNSCNNIERTWITSTVWPPKSWSMFNQHRWTKNNAEGKDQR
jgi:hypothetical protein